MSAREWVPGDVAMVTARWVRTDDHSERQAVRVSAGWTSRSGSHVADWETSDVRALIIIDPAALVDCVEDQHLIGQWLRVVASGDMAGLPRTMLVQRLADAIDMQMPEDLKPNEPQGLGAVVEDDRGALFVRAGDGWLPSTVPGPFRNPIGWSDVVAVRVLSEGVRP